MRIAIVTVRLNLAPELGDKTLTSELVEIIAVYCTMEGFTTILYVLFMFCICIFYFVLLYSNLLPRALVECVLDISALVRLHDADQQGQEEHHATHL